MLFRVTVRVWRGIQQRFHKARVTDKDGFRGTNKVHSRPVAIV